MCLPLYSFVFSRTCRRQPTYQQWYFSLFLFHSKYPLSSSYSFHHPSCPPFILSSPSSLLPSSASVIKRPVIYASVLCVDQTDRPEGPGGFQWLLKTHHEKNYSKVRVEIFILIINSLNHCKSRHLYIIKAYLTLPAFSYYKPTIPLRRSRQTNIHTKVLNNLINLSTDVSDK